MLQIKLSHFAGAEYFLRNPCVHSRSAKRSVRGEVIVWTLNISMQYYRCSRCSMISSLSFTWAPVASENSCTPKTPSILQSEQEKEQCKLLLCVWNVLILLLFQFRARNETRPYSSYCISIKIWKCATSCQNTPVHNAAANDMYGAVRGKNPNMMLFVMSWPAHKTRMHVYTERVFGGRKFALHSELTSENSRETSSGTCVNRSWASEGMNGGDVFNVSSVCAKIEPTRSFLYMG